MAKQNAKTNGSQNGSGEDVEALKNRLTVLSEKSLDRELKKLSPVELHDLVVFTAPANAQPKGRRAKHASVPEPAPQSEYMTEMAVRGLFLKAYFDSLDEKTHDRELKKLSRGELHLLVWASAYQNAQRSRKRR